MFLSVKRGKLSMNTKCSAFVFLEGQNNRSCEFLFERAGHSMFQTYFEGGDRGHLTEVPFTQILAVNFFTLLRIVFQQLVWGFSPHFLPPPPFKPRLGESEIPVLSPSRHSTTTPTNSAGILRNFSALKEARNETEKCVQMRIVRRGR